MQKFWIPIPNLQSKPAIGMHSARELDLGSLFVRVPVVFAFEFAFVFAYGFPFPFAVVFADGFAVEFA